MTEEQIKAALESGTEVCWRSRENKVIAKDNGLYVVLPEFNNFHFFMDKKSLKECKVVCPQASFFIAQAEAL